MSAYLFQTRTICLIGGERHVALVLRAGRAMPVFVSFDLSTALTVYQKLRGGSRHGH